MRDALSELLRPREFSDLLQPQQIIGSLEAMAMAKSPNNMLFYGSPGLGKSSAARILLARLGDNSFEINGSLDNGIDVVRKIESGATSCGLGSGPRVCLIDEADYLSKQAQAGLRGLIEKVYTNCRFILTANSVRKIDPALRSRCMPICFDVPASACSEIIARVLPKYLKQLRTLNIEIEEKRVRELFPIYFPDLRGLANTIEFEALSREIASG